MRVKVRVRVRVNSIMRVGVRNGKRESERAILPHSRQAAFIAVSQNMQTCKIRATGVHGCLHERLSGARASPMSHRRSAARRKVS